MAQIDAAYYQELFANVQIGVAPAAGQQAVTALSVRTAYATPALAGDDIGRANNFGVASNRAVLDLFLQIAPIMRQFAVSTCNAGVFSGRFAHASVIKMTQLLSYIRLRLSGSIVDLNREGIAMMQAYAMAELFGAYIPADYKLEQVAARRAIVEAVHGYLHSDFMDMPDNWYHPSLGLGNDLAAVEAITVANMTIHQALVLLEAWASLIPTSREWLNGISMIACVYTSLCKQGSLTPKAAQKIINGIKSDHPGVEVFVPDRTVRVFFTNFSRHVNETNAAALFTHYAAITPEMSIRLLAIVTQASDSGMTVFTIIRRALNENQDFPYWRLAVDRFPEDFAHFANALAIVGQNHYYGFRRNLEAVAANRYKSLGYLCQQILIHLGGDDPLAKYNGLKGTIPGKPWIDSIIQRVLDEEVNFAFNTPPSAESGHTLNNILHLIANPQGNNEGAGAGGAGAGGA